ncbi:MAG: hypothetical protein ACYC3I_03940 [Gemmataceae bacterium]
MVAETVSRALKLILVVLDERGKRAVELGRWVDRGVHPRAVYRYMCQGPKSGPVEPVPADISLDALWSGEYNRMGSVSDTESDLPPVLYSIKGERLEPETGWMDQVDSCCRALGLPESLIESFQALQQEACGSTVENRVENYVANLDKLIRDELTDLAPPHQEEKIPPGERTRPMTLKDAARFMGKGGTKAGVKLVRALIKSGVIPCISITRQTHIFRKSDFPSEVRSKIS